MRYQPPRFRLPAWVLSAVILGCALLGSGETAPAGHLKTAKPLLSPTVDQLLGEKGRETHAAVLAKRTYNGNAFTWEQYAGWGRELVLNGFVRNNPPVGKGPSAKLSEHYRCLHCHNIEREDSTLTKQDPEARATLILAKPPEKPELRDGTVASLTPGTTLWGAVNRERFYNGHFKTYHRLTIAGGDTMNPAKLADAVQVCCRYCSGGRFPDPWELDAIMTYLWDLELKIKDLELPEDTAKSLKADLTGSDVAARTAARKMLKEQYLIAAGATRQKVPVKSDKNADTYDDNAALKGDPKAGKFLYLSACAGCHGGDVNPLEYKKLTEQAERYHQFIWKGTERDGRYMPFFPKERLSRQQAADIRAFIQNSEN